MSSLLLRDAMPTYILPPFEMPFDADDTLLFSPLDDAAYALITPCHFFFDFR